MFNTYQHLSIIFINHAINLCDLKYENQVGSSNNINDGRCRQILHNSHQALDNWCDPKSEVAAYKYPTVRDACVLTRRTTIGGFKCVVAEYEQPHPSCYQLDP